MKGTIHTTCLLALFFALSCSRPYEIPEVKRDIDAIRNDTLRVAIAPGRLGIEKRGQRSVGLERAIIDFFVAHEALRVSFIPTNNADTAFAMLRRGDVDVAAGLFSSNSVQRAQLASSCPYVSSPAVLVTLKNDPWYGHYWGHRGYPAKIEQDYSLIDSISVSTIHEPMLLHDSTKTLLAVDSLNPEQLLEAVALGKIPQALVSSVLARAYARDYPHVSIDEAPLGDIDLSFAFRNSSAHLKGALDSFLGRAENWAKIDALTAAHSEPSLRRAKGAFSHPHHSASEQISGFDDAFKMAAEETGLDWKFLAALAFKESRFDTTANSNKGALGIMQLVPSTAEAMEIDSALGEVGAIAAAARYLKSLDRMFRKSVPNKNERLGFLLAAYNAGPGHVLDAQRLAELKGLDPTRWQGHTERALLLLANPAYYTHSSIKHGYCKGYSIFLFVREVLQYWKHYKRIGIK